MTAVMKTTSFVFITLALLVHDVSSFATPSSDFLLGIDGSSVATGYGHVCVLEQKATDGIGGRAQCWGQEHKEGATNAPKDVSYEAF
jgi:hypothetical protein